MGVIGEQDDMQVINALGEKGQPWELARDTKADVLLMGAADHTGDYSQLLRGDPNLKKVFGLTPDGRTAFQYELKLERRTFSEVSSQDLVRAIRDTALDRAGDRE